MRRGVIPFAVGAELSVFLYFYYLFLLHIVLFSEYLELAKVGVVVVGKG